MTPTIQALTRGPRDSTNRRRRRTGTSSFTLIELLVVAIIIVVLAALLLPAVMESKTTSYRVYCSSNLHSAGLALAAYSMDFEMYPLSDALVQALRDEDYLGVGDDFRCPLDHSAPQDTYSLGYIGGHPKTIEETDPLVVCGWHRRMGSLAVFPDASVGDLNQRRGGSSLPVTMTSMASGEVEPGITLHTGDPILITGGGKSTLVSGANGVALVSASYDPIGDAFTLVADFDSDTAGAKPISSVTNADINFFTRLQYATVHSTLAKSNTGLSWSPGATENTLSLSQVRNYRVTHRIVGRKFSDASETAIPAATFKATASSLVKQ